MTKLVHLVKKLNHKFRYCQLSTASVSSEDSPLILETRYLQLSSLIYVEKTQVGYGRCGRSYSSPDHTDGGDDQGFWPYPPIITPASSFRLFWCHLFSVEWGSRLSIYRYRCYLLQYSQKTVADITIEHFLGRFHLPLVSPVSLSDRDSVYLDPSDDPRTVLNFF